MKPNLHIWPKYNPCPYETAEINNKHNIRTHIKYMCHKYKIYHCTWLVQLGIIDISKKDQIYIKRTSKCYILLHLTSPLGIPNANCTLIFSSNINLNLLDFTFECTTLLKSWLWTYGQMYGCIGGQCCSLRCTLQVYQIWALYPLSVQRYLLICQLWNYPVLDL